MEKTIQILALSAAICAAFSNYMQENINASVAWGCCVLWIITNMITEHSLKQTQELVDILKKENKILKNKML